MSARPHSFSRRVGAVVVSTAMALVGLTTFAVPASAAPPANDDIVDSIEIDLATMPYASAAVSRLEATLETEEPASWHPQSVWWHFTPTAETYVDISGVGSTGSATGILYSYNRIGTPAMNELTQESWANFGVGARMVHRVSPDVTYYIKVGSTDQNGVSTEENAVTQIQVAAPVADLAITDFTATPVPGKVGENVRITTYANNSYAARNAYDLTMTISLPPEVDFTSAEGGCVHSGADEGGNGGTVTCTRGELPSGWQWNPWIDVQAETAGAEVPLSAAIASGNADSDPSNNTYAETFVVEDPVRPANDSFADAIDVDVSTVQADPAVTVTTDQVNRRDATFESGEPSAHCAPDAQTVWWKLTPSQAGFLQANFAGPSGPWRSIAVYSTPADTAPSLSNLTLLDCYDIYWDSAEYGGTFEVEADRTYYVQAGSNDAYLDTDPAQTTAALVFKQPAPDLDLYHFVDNPDPVTVGEPVHYLSYARNNSDKERALHATLSQTLPSTVAFSSANTSAGTCAHSGEATGGTVTCTRDVLNRNEHWYMNVYGTATSAGAATTTTAAVDAETLDGNAANDSRTIDTTSNQPSRPANDSFADAALIDVTTAQADPAVTVTSDQVDRLDATFEEGEPSASCAPGHQSVWWKLTPSQAGHLQANLGGPSGPWRGIAVYAAPTDADATLGNLTLLDCYELYWDSAQYGATFEVEADRTYYVQAGSSDDVRDTDPATTVMTLAVKQATPDLQVYSLEDSPDPVTVDQPVRYVTGSRNNSDKERAFDVALTQDLPSTVTFSSASAYAASCSLSGEALDGSGGTVTCTRDVLNRGEYWSMEVHAVASSAGAAVPTTATIDAANLDLTPGNDSLTIETTTNEPNPPVNDHFADATVVDVTAAQADPAVTVTAETVNRLDATLEEGEPTASCAPGGQTAWWKVTPTQDGFLQANLDGPYGPWRNIAVYAAPTDADASLANLTLLDCYELYWTGAYGATFQAEAGRTYYVQAGSYDGTRVAEPTQTWMTLSFRQASADLNLYSFGESSDPVKVGDSYSYSSYVHNSSGTDHAFGVTLTQQLPANVTYSSVIPSTEAACTHTGADEDGSGGIVSCLIDRLNRGSHYWMTVNVTAALSGTIVESTATVSSLTPDANTTNDARTIQTKITAPYAEVSVALSGPTSPVLLGDSASYTTTMSNAGVDTAPNVILEHTVPAGMTLTGATASQGTCTTEGNVASCAVGSVAMDANATMTVTAEAVDPGQVTHSSRVRADLDQRVVSDDVDTVITTLQDRPHPVDLEPAVAEDGSVGIELQAVDRDSAGAELTFFVVDAPDHGTLSGVTPEGELLLAGEPAELDPATSLSGVTVTYTPTANENDVSTGGDSFTYSVCDTDGNCSLADAVVDLTVSAVNDAPVAVADAITTAEDVSSVAVDLSGNDTDVDLTREGDELTVVSVADPANGTAVLGEDGTVVYTGDLHFNGQDTFTYVVEDRAGMSSQETVTVTVTPVNDAPVTADDAATTVEDTAVDVAVLVNDEDVDTSREGDTRALTIAAAPSAGTAVVQEDGTLRYTPAADANGSFAQDPTTDSFSYTWTDKDGAASTSTVTVTVTPVNDAPVASDDAATIAEDTTSTIDVLANDGDVDVSREGDTLSVSVGTQPAHGTVTCSTAGSCVYTPEQHWNGVDSYTYVVSDTGSAQDTGTVSITVTPVNDAPVTADDAATTAEDTAVDVAVLGNDEDVDTSREGDIRVLTIATAPSAGTAVVQEDGTIRYTPAANANSSFAQDPTTDSFSYTWTDKDGVASTSTVTVTVTPVNDAPVAADDAATIAEDTTSTIDVLANDGDVDVSREGDTLSVSVAMQPGHGTVTCSTAGSCVYTPEQHWNGVDSYTYVVSDTGSAQDTGTVTITVTPVNDTPGAVDDAAETAEDTAVVLDVLVNDGDVDLSRETDTQTVAVTIAPEHGTAVVGTDGRVTYTPAANWHGTDGFTYTYTDRDGLTDSAVATVTITPVNDAPVALTRDVTTAEDTASAAFDIAGADLDVDQGDVLTISVTSAPANGSLVCTDGTACVYTPSANFHGLDSVSYTVTDAGGLSDAGTVEIVVTSVNDAPVAQAFAGQTDEDVALPLALAGSDVDGDALAFGVETAPANGVVSCGTGGCTYTPDANWSGTDTFVYRVSDGTAYDTAEAVVEVAAVNDAPVALVRTVSTTEDAASAPFDVLGADLDADAGDTLTVEITEEPVNGTLSCTDGTGCVYTPWPDFSGTDSAAYTVTDAEGASDSSTIGITVTSINDAPVATDVAVATDEDVPVPVELPATDVDGDELSFSVTTGPAHGEVSCDDFVCVYTPDENWSGSDAFTFSASDGAASDTGDVTLEVAAVNDAPTTESVSVTVPQDSTANPLTLLASDVDGDPLTYAVTNAGHGTVVCEGASCSYTPDAGFTGADDFGFTATDPDGEVGYGVVHVTVTPTAPSPSASPTAGPTGSPTSSPTPSPTGTATSEPTSSPTGEPTSSPTGEPTVAPTTSPTTSPTGSPTSSPTGPTPLPLDLETSTSTDPEGTATASSSDGDTEIVQAVAQGAGTLIVGRFDDNPVGPAGFDASGTFFDVYVEPGSEFTSLVIRTCELNGGTTLRWWDPTGEGAWRDVSDATYLPGPPACIEALVDDTTSPSLDELTGTVFAVANDAGLYTPVVPSRIYDSRRVSDGAVAAGADRKVQVLGQGGVPASGVTAVVVNLTGVGATAPADVQVYPTGRRPERRTSNLNLQRGPAVADLVTTAVGDDGTISLSTSTGAAHLVLDVVGWYGDGTAAGGSAFRSLTPSRLFDSRVGVTPISAGTDRDVSVLGRGGVPRSGVDAVVVNTTVVGSTRATDVQLYPTGSRPAVRTSNVNVPGAGARANLAVVKVGEDGRISLSTSSGSTHVVLDVVGWYGARTESDSGLRFEALTPVRMYDSRVGRGGVVAGEDRVVALRHSTVPQRAQAVVTTATVVGATQPADVQLFPTGFRPERRTSNVNVASSAAVPNLVFVGLGEGGAVSVSSSAGAPHVVLDVVGYFVE